MYSQHDQYWTAPLACVAAGTTSQVTCSGGWCAGQRSLHTNEHLVPVALGSVPGLALASALTSSRCGAAAGDTVATGTVATDCGPATAESGDWSFDSDCVAVMLEGVTGLDDCEAFCNDNSAEFCALNDGPTVAVPVCWGYFATAQQGCTPGIVDPTHMRWVPCGMPARLLWMRAADTGGCSSMPATRPLPACLRCSCALTFTRIQVLRVPPAGLPRCRNRRPTSRPATSRDIPTSWRRWRSPSDHSHPSGHSRDTRRPGQRCATTGYTYNACNTRRHGRRRGRRCVTTGYTHNRW